MSFINDSFEKYVQDALKTEHKGPEVDRVKGIMPCKRRFVIVTSKIAWYAVRLIIEPYTDKNGIYVKPYPEVTREGFFLESAASEYVQELLYELQAKSNSICRQFDQHVTESIHRYSSDKELLRLRGQDADGKRFAFVLLETSNKSYVTLCITEPAKDDQDIYNPELELSKEYTSITEAKKSFFDDFHKRKQLHEKDHFPSPHYKSHHEVKVITKFTNENQYVDIDIPEGPETCANFPKDNIKPADRFKKFVQQCWAHSIGGEEVCRRFGVTKTGQRLAFVVLKYNHYSVLVVLEPDPRYSQWFDEKETVTTHSFTIRLKKITTRKMMDSWIERISKIWFMKKIDLEKTEKPSYAWAAEGPLIPTKDDCVSKPDNYLIRGDYIRRNLKVTVFNITYHDGIYLGKGKVAHFTPKNGTGIFSSKRGSGAEIVPISKFAKGERIMIASYVSRPRSFHEVAQEAERLVEMRTWETRYNVVERNCQVFVRLCLNYKPTKKEFVAMFMQTVNFLGEISSD